MPSRRCPQDSYLALSVQTLLKLGKEVLPPIKQSFRKETGGCARKNDLSQLINEVVPAYPSNLKCDSLATTGYSNISPARS